MNKEQEYIEFWTSIIGKLKEIEKDYNNLSDENKCRADYVKETILRAHTYADIVQILRAQVKKTTL